VTPTEATPIFCSNFRLKQPVDLIEADAIHDPVVLTEINQHKQSV